METAAKLERLGVEQPDLEPDTLARVLATPDEAAATLRGLLDDANAELKERFLANEPVDELVAAHSNVVGHVIVACWTHFCPDLAAGETVDLVAVGGYGRGELQPHSDIDLLVLLGTETPDGAEEQVSRFLTFLWDLGLEVGQSVRTLADCAEQANRDVTVLTTLMETRLLAGAGRLFVELPAHISPGKMWSSAEFYRAKTSEQAQRHGRYHDTAYNLEPNVKGSPGGLRDIQMISWIARRHLGTTRLEQLVDHGYLTGGQLRILVAAQSFLRRIRYGLHLLTGRREDRLLFDHQIKLAKMLGYEDASYTLGVEQLMQRYYRTAMEVSRLNEMLLQLFEEAILLDANAPAVELSEQFQARNGYLEARDADVFTREPSALLEIFVLLEKNMSLRGVNARTIALIRQHLWLIDEEFRQNPRHHRLFLEILKAPQGVTRTLKRMNTYGVLGLYIPAFGRIVGRMQYDLFHAYTVDQHTLFVVENLRRMALPRFNEEHANGSAIMQSLDKPEIAYLAGMFHDIAKGRGGDHSELGAVDAESFCLEHGMSRYDARLVAWLVRHHLLLSLTAQKKDISDPGVVHEFAQTIGDLRHLEFLYVLTIADLRATNPKIWNSWKDTLFWELFESTKRALRRGSANPIDKDEIIAETQAEARALLVEDGISEGDVHAVWDDFNEEYFLRHRPEEVAWHTRVLAGARPSQAPLVDVEDTIADGLTVIMVYAPTRLRSFMRTTAVLDELGLNVVDARIVPLSGEQRLDTYCVLERDGRPIEEPNRLAEIKDRIDTSLAEAEAQRIRVTRRAPRQVRMFSTPTRISISRDDENGRTIIEIVAGDRPGLLFLVGQALEKEDVVLHNAKIMTVGERAEDVFFVTTADSRPLADEHSGRLRETLEQTLSESTA